MKVILIIFIILFNYELLSSKINVGDEVLVFSKSGLVLREQANKKSNKLATIPSGSIIKIKEKIDSNTWEVIDKLSGYWIKVEYNNIDGFVFSGYLVKINKYNQNNTMLSYVIENAIVLFKKKMRNENYEYLHVDEIIIKKNFVLVKIYFSNQESIITYTADSYLFTFSEKSFKFLKDFNHYTQRGYLDDFNGDGEIDILIERSGDSHSWWFLYLQNISKKDSFNNAIEVDNEALIIHNLGKCENLIITQDFPFNKDHEIITYYFDCNKNQFRKKED